MKKKNINLLNCFTFIKEKRKSNQYTHPNIGTIFGFFFCFLGFQENHPYLFLFIFFDFFSGFFKQLLEFENSIFGENSMTIEQYEQITKSLSQY